MSRPVWLVELIKKSFPGRFLAARATRLPLLGRMIDHLLLEMPSRSKHPSRALPHGSMSREG